MRAVWAKTKADLAGRPWQSVLILCTVGLASALLYLGVVTLTASASPFDKLMSKTNGAHVWFTIAGDHAGTQTAAQLAGLSGVSASYVRPNFITYLRLFGSDSRVPVHVVAVSSGTPSVGGFLMVEGKALEADDRGIGILDASMARALGIHPGDKLEVAGGGRHTAITISGFMVEPMMCSYPDCKPSSLYVLPDTFQAIVGRDQGVGYLVGLQLSSPAQADEFITKTEKIVGGAGIKDAWSWRAIRQFGVSTQAFNALFILSFAVMAVVTSVMITANIIAGAVLNQYRDIGVLKALGFTQGQVLLVFEAQTLVLSVVGAALGVIGGHAIALRILRPLAQSMGATDTLSFQPTIAALVIATGVLIAFVVTGVACWRAVRTRPAEILGSGFSVPQARTPLLVRFMTVVGAPVAAVLGVKDAVARRGRAGMTAISLALCLVTIAMSASIVNLMNRYEHEPSLRGIHYDLVVKPVGVAPMAVVADIASGPAVATFYTETTRIALMVDQDLLIGLKGIGGRDPQTSLTLLAGRFPAGLSEIVLAPGAMQKLGVHVGDSLRMSVEGHVTNITVVGEYQEMSNFGQMGAVTLETLQLLAPTALPEAIYVKVDAGISPAVVRQAILERTGFSVAADQVSSALPSFVKQVPAMVKLLCIFMAAVAALSVLNSALLNAREHMKEVGIRKAVGMTPAQIFAGVASGGAWLGVLAAATGVPMGMLLNAGLVSAMSQSVGVKVTGVALPPGVIGLLIGAGIALGATAPLPAAITAAHVSTAEVLQAD